MAWISSVFIFLLTLQTIYADADYTTTPTFVVTTPPVEAAPLTLSDHYHIFLLEPRNLTYLLLRTDDENSTDHQRIDLPNEASGVLSIDYHPVQRRLYYTTTPRASDWSKNSRLYSIPWDHECDDCRSRVVEVLREENYWNPRSLAVDYLNDKLYFVDSSDRSISVMNLDGHNRCTIFEDEPLIPYELSLDPAEAYIFALAINTRTDTLQIYRLNMDGSEPVLLLDRMRRKSALQLRDKVGFCLDTMRRRVYFADGYDAFIGSFGYEGGDGALVARAENVTSIGVRNDTMYWFDAGAHSLKSCKLNLTSPAASCYSSTIRALHHDDRSVVRAIALIDPSLQRRVDDPCAGGGCQHHCLLKKVVGSADEDGYYDAEMSLGHACACDKGWRLKRDRRGCTREMITHTYDDFLIPHLATFAELYYYAYKDTPSFYPLSRNLLVRLSYSRADACFVRDPADFVVVDDSGSRLVARSMLPKKSGEDKIVKVYEGRRIAKVLAYDWITKNLYYVLVSNDDDDETGESFVTRYDDGADKAEKSLGRIPLPTFMAIHPYNGYVFAALRNGTICRFHTDGTNVTLLPNVGNVGGVVAVDLNDDQLYYVDSEGYVGRARLDGTGVVRVTNDAPRKIDFAYVYDKWLYVKSGDRLVRYDKASGEATGTLTSDAENFRRESVGVKVKARDARFVNGYEHPCVEENGGCEGYCFGVMGEEAMELRKVCG